MLRKLGILGLLLFRATGTSANNSTCVTRPSAFALPMCHDNYDSICPLGHTYLNKMSIFNEETYFKSAEIIVSRRKESSKEAQWIADIVHEKLISERNQLFSGMSADIFNKLIDYLKLVIDLRVKTHSHSLGKGACGEAAKASISQSLLRQLETGNRETVQLFSVHTDEALMPSTGFGLGGLNHFFAIYNSKMITGRSIKGNAELNTILQNLVPKNLTKPVIACDAWGDYHATTDRWVEHLRRGKDHYYGGVNWKKIQVADYSLPSMRTKEWNSQQRKFFIDLMLDILKPNRLTKSKVRGQSNKKASLRKRH